VEIRLENMSVMKMQLQQVVTWAVFT